MFFFQKAVDDAEKGRKVHVFAMDDLFKLNDHSLIPDGLSNIEGLKELPFDFAYVPSGIYFLCKGKEISYIGQTTNFGNRMTAHYRDAIIPFDRIYFMTCHIDKLNEVERAFISHFQPKHNSKARGMDAVMAKEIVERSKAA